MAIQADGKILIGGYFENVGGQSRVSIARLNTDGSVDTGFNPAIGGIPLHEIYEITLDRNGNILIGGKFDTVNGSPRQNIARLLTSGALDTTFAGPSIDGPVLKIIPDLNHAIYIGGRFLNIGGIPTPGVGELTDIGQVVGFPNTGANDVLSMTIRSDNKILLSGYFTTVNGQPRAQFAALRGQNASGSELIASPGSIVWQRSVNDTEVMRAQFERSVDGVNYTPLGEGTRGASSEWTLNIPNANATGYVRVRGFAGDFSVQRSVFEQVLYVHQPPVSSVPFDFDGDGKSDIGIFRPGPGEWWINRSSTGMTFAAQFGVSTDKIVPADYTGDGKADIAFWRPSTGEWFILRSENSTFYSVPFGVSTDIPAPGDFDGDGKADTTVFRPSTATWYIQRSADNGTTISSFGTNGDVPVAADYDGDGRADIAIFRPSNGQWWLLRSSAGIIAASFGDASDKLVPGDYTGDGKADIALWRPSTGEWFILRSENSTFYSVPFGINPDIPAPGDYDGDGRFDTTIFRPSTATWYIQRSTAGTLIQTFGVSTDRPVANAYVR
jgi:uncharacterized delta-60 repeat protein